jgi:hypothetical protein
VPRAGAGCDGDLPKARTSSTGLDSGTIRLTTMFKAIIANNRAGGWRRLKRQV